MDRQHEDKRADDGGNAREKLREAEQETVRELIHVRNDPADRRAVRMGIHIAKRQARQGREGVPAHIADHAVGDPVVERIHHPLQKGAKSRRDPDFHEVLRDPGEIDRAFADHAVDRAAAEDRDIEGEDDGQRREEDRQGEKGNGILQIGQEPDPCLPSHGGLFFFGLHALPSSFAYWDWAISR